jgi:hypothetical protein
VYVCILSVLYIHIYREGGGLYGTIEIIVCRGKYSFMVFQDFMYSFFFFVPLPPFRGLPTILFHSRWQPHQELSEFAMVWEAARFEPGASAVQSRTLPLNISPFRIS